MSCVYTGGEYGRSYNSKKAMESCLCKDTNFFKVVQVRGNTLLLKTLVQEMFRIYHVAESITSVVKFVVDSRHKRMS